jgi:NADPH:quinone reductase-like Zn-dependent oxidoreductase
MKALVQERYGAPHELLELREVDEPAPADDAVLVRVHATSVNPADWHMLRGDPRIARLQMGLGKPKASVMGSDVAGTVEAVGPSVATFKPGDEVFANSFGRGFGAFAERVVVPEDLLAHKPSNLSFEQAAAVPLAGMTAVQGLRDHGKVEPGQRVVIVGASGGVGTFAIQLAKFLGAEVTGVCSSTKVELVGSLGADHVVDYTREDFVNGGQRYDVIFQLAGTSSPSKLRRALTPKGTLVGSSGESDGHWIGPLGRMFKTAAPLTAREPEADHIHDEARRRRPALPEGTHRSRGREAGDRQDLPRAQRSAGGDPLSRAGPRTRQDRHNGVTALAGH